MRKHQTLRRIVGAALVATITAGVMLALPSPAMASNHERIQNWNSSLAAHVDSRVPGAPVSQQPYGFSTKEQWNKIAVNGGTAYLFQNWYSGLCMDVGGVPLNGAPIVQTRCDINNVRQWWFRVLDPDPNLPVWHIFNAFTGYYLAVENLSIVAGAALIQERYSSTSPAQMWQMWG